MGICDRTWISPRSQENIECLVLFYIINKKKPLCKKPTLRLQEGDFVLVFGLSVICYGNVLSLLLV